MGEPNAQVACKSDQNSVHPSARPYVCTSTQNVVFNPAYFLTTGTIGPAAPNACRHLQSSPWSQLRPSSIAKLPHHTSSWGIDHKQMQSRKCLPTPPTQKSPKKIAPHTIFSTPPYSELYTLRLRLNVAV